MGLARMVDQQVRQISAELARGSLADAELLRLQVTSNSMSPMLLPDDVIVVQAVRVSSLQRGDIVVVQSKDTLITHRLIDRRVSGCLTKGDRSASPDPWWPEKNIVGRVASIERAGHSIDLSRRRRQIANRLLGQLSWWQARLWTLGRRVQKKRISGASPVWTSVLTRLLAFSFRILMRLIGLLAR